MAPCAKHAVATVYSAHVRSIDQRSIEVEAGGFQPAKWFLDHGSPSDAEDSEPPRKRRKTDSTPENDDEGAQSRPAQGDLIPLFEAAIDFHFPETLHTRDASKEAISNDVDFEGVASVSVLPCSIWSTNMGTSLRLTYSTSKGPSLTLACGSIPNEVVDMIRTIAPPEHLMARTASKRAKQHPASVITCTLTRSRGDLYTVLRLQTSLKWRSGASAFPSGAPAGASKVYPDYEWLLEAYKNNARDSFDHSQRWTPQDFYESAHVPPFNTATHQIFKRVLGVELYPFQKRAVSWMLNREGVQSSQAIGTRPPKNRHSADFYESVEDLEGKECFVNHLQGIVTRTPPEVGACYLSGGLLAEEMGLGKTVELMSLVSLHQRPQEPAGQIVDEVSGIKVTRSKATLIITPPSILQQWQSELNRHAPQLAVYHYRGIASGSKEAPPEEEVIQDLATNHDVVLITYATLAREVHFAQEEPNRSRRHARRFERKRSPLVQLEWWRVCLDEAQMVESGVTAAARVACRLPRVHSWAVSGTPLRKNVEDLHGLLIFLRYTPFSEQPKLWSHLIRNHRHLFKQVFNKIALRHTKALIRHELSLPPQKRVVVTVPFSVVEQQNYATLFEQMCKEVGLSGTGAPLDGGWDPDDPSTVEGMRKWLVRLRQTCLHPQVGGHNRKALGRGSKPLRTVAEVLEVMIEQNETDIRTEERALISASLHRAHVLGNNGSDERRSEKAMAVYEEAMKTTGEMVEQARGKLAAAKAAHADKDEGPPTDGDEADEELAADSTSVLGRLRTSLRIALQHHHACTFFAATSYFQIKTNESITSAGSDRFAEMEAKETELYETAKAFRKEILKDTVRKAEQPMLQVRTLANSDTFTKLPTVKELQNLGGIESRRILEKSRELFSVIRQVLELIEEWRAKIAESLAKALVDEEAEGNETTGDEYEDSTKQQDEMYVYFDMFKAAHADLNSLVTGETAPLVDHEMKVQVRLVKKFLDPEVLEDEKTPVHAPELALKLADLRNKLRQRHGQVGSVRGLIQEARALDSSFLGVSSRAAEKTIVQRYLVALQTVFSMHSKALNGLEKEVDLFRTAQNLRVEFYRQLQELSDTVAPFKNELDPQLDQASLDIALQREKEASKFLAQLKTKNRFLTHIRDNDQAGPKICIICTSAFERGVLTVCGHQFCKECIDVWFKQAHSCPMCKRRLTKNDIHDITFRPQELRAQEEAQAGESSASRDASSVSPSDPSTSNGSSLYTDVDTAVMEEIKSIELPSSYGTKIDTLARHLHWIRDHDPGAKSIVFSQYKDFLDVLAGALKAFKIGHARLGRTGAADKFKSSPSIDCLLLDAKTDSSGLTLVNATHVFICEPMIQTAVELQAIARVHRIGQTRPTTVWMYLINDTVEEAIYEISVARRLAHVQARQRSKRSDKSRSSTPAPLQEHAIDAANSEEMQSAPLTKLLAAGKAGGELVDKDDLWQCLFGKGQETPAPRNAAAEHEVGRHLRAEAAERRQQDAPASGEELDE